jgi:hypothetical protein
MRTSPPCAAPSRPAPAGPTGRSSAGSWPSSAPPPGPTTSTWNGSLSSSPAGGRTGRRRRGTSRWTPSGPPRRTGSGRAGSPPPSPACSNAASPGPDRSRALSRSAVVQLLTCEDISLHERTLWRMLYETAARPAKLLALDVEDLDLPNRRTRIRRKGGAIDVIMCQTGAARLLLSLLKGHRTGPVFVTTRKARVQLPAADLDSSGRARLSYQGAAGAIHQGLRRRDPAPAPPLRADARRRERHRDTDAHGPVRPHVRAFAGESLGRAPRARRYVPAPPRR